MTGIARANKKEKEACVEEFSKEPKTPQSNKQSRRRVRRDDQKRRQTLRPGFDHEGEQMSVSPRGRRWLVHLVLIVQSARWSHGPLAADLSFERTILIVSEEAHEEKSQARGRWSYER